MEISGKGEKMAKNIVIIGGVALGPKVACRIRRLDPDAQILVVDRDRYISYGGCGIPYYVGGDVPELKSLFSTSAHVVRDGLFFRNAKRVAVQTETETIAIDRAAKTVTLRYLPDNTVRQMPYDTLVMATGGQPVVPPIPGMDLPGVTVVATPHHGHVIKQMIASGKVRRAVVVGGGAIGLEMAEALADLWDVETTLVEMQDQLLPGPLGHEMALIVKNHVEEKGVCVRLSDQVTRIQGNHETGVTGVETGTDAIPCELVVMAVGVRPNAALARHAGLALGPRGGVLVDHFMKTSDPDIYAGGDCVEIPHLISGKPVHMPLGSLANRQGRVIGTNVAGGRATFPGTTGAFCIKIFDLAVARSGLTFIQSAEAGFDPVQVVVAQADRAHFYPTREMMCMKLIADRGTRRVLGVEAVGPNGDAVKARVDAVAAVLPFAATLDVISNLEVAYAPPFAAAMDIVNSAANALENTIEGRHRTVDIDDFLKEFTGQHAKVLDVRSAVQAEPYIRKFGDQWRNIPQEELIDHTDEFDADEPLFLICGAGPRSYEAQLLLRSRGVAATRNVQGGMKMLQACAPDFLTDTKEDPFDTTVVNGLKPAYAK
jgi:NADPH-dependent 2,4-dienoyl-CoA reductase/sulfur reductase-like enzyme/rhodanese-related sulfurtransferase